MKIFMSLFATASILAAGVDSQETNDAVHRQGTRKNLRGQRSGPERQLSNPFNEEEKPVPERQLTGEVIVKRQTPAALRAQGKSEEQINAMRAQGMNVIREKEVVFESRGSDDDGDDFQVVKVGLGAEAEYIQQLMTGRHSHLFQYAEANYLASTTISPDDPLLSSQWHHTKMQSREAWDISVGSSDFSVAICDTGIETTHPDLQGNMLEGYNSVDQKWESEGGTVEYVDNHGTLCTGCAASIGNNGVGISGVGWNFKHRPGRVTNTAGQATFANIADCAKRMCDKPDVKAVSASWSVPEAASRLDAASYCKQRGALMVNAAGNDGRDLTQFGHADNDDLIVVGATDTNDNKASFSAFGSFVDVFAPGTSIYTTKLQGAYMHVQGTSFSAPLAAGLIALIWSVEPSLTPNEVETILKMGADDVGLAGAYGRINSKTSVQAAESGTAFPTDSPTTPPPTPSPTTSPPTPSPVATEATVTATYDGTCPRCAVVGGACTSGDLLNSRGSSLGVAEPNNAQNSLDGCVDGNSGVYTDDESIEVIEVSASGGGLLQVGKGAVIKANIYAWGTGSSSYADFYFKDMNGPNTDWTYIATRSPSGGNAQEVVSPTFVLTSTQMAVRVNLRYNGNPSPCSGGNYDEADDLVFAVAAGPSSSPSGQPTQSAQPSQSATPTNAPSATPSVTPTTVPSAAPSDKPSTSHAPSPGSVTKFFCARSNQLTNGVLSEEWCPNPDSDQCDPNNDQCGGNKSCYSVTCPYVPPVNPPSGTPAPTSQPTSGPTQSLGGGGGTTPSECQVCSQHGDKDICNNCGGQGSKVYCTWQGNPTSGSCNNVVSR